MNGEVNNALTIVTVNDAFEGYLAFWYLVAFADEAIDFPEVCISLDDVMVLPFSSPSCRGRCSNGPASRTTSTRTASRGVGGGPQPLEGLACKLRKSCGN